MSPPTEADRHGAKPPAVSSATLRMVVGPFLGAESRRPRRPRVSAERTGRINGGRGQPIGHPAAEPGSKGPDQPSVQAAMALLGYCGRRDMTCSMPRATTAPQETGDWRHWPVLPSGYAPATAPATARGW